MNQTRLRLALPYFVGLIIAGVLFDSANHIQFTQRGNELGPDFWPKVAIGLMAVVCVIEILRAMVGAAGAYGISHALEQTEETEEPSYFHLLIGGVALILGYAILVPILGFLLGSLLFMTAFMYLGRYRNHVAIWTISGVATFIVAFLFLRFAYVSLPRGEPPFDRFTDLIRVMVGG
jgi:Na+-transporting NADH:ubiquinone oxidoreductase subunit NqrB